jgi:preprotein translocase subunit SecA
MAHLEHMDHIRQSVNLRAYGQRDPLVEYKKEALITYRAMQDKTKEEFYNFITHIDDVIANLEAQRIMTSSHAKNRTFTNNNSDSKEVSPINKKEGEDKKKIGRNDLCPCGSGKKVKKCDCVEYEYLRK